MYKSLNTGYNLGFIFKHFWTKQGASKHFCDHVYHSDEVFSKSGYFA